MFGEYLHFSGKEFSECISDYTVQEKLHLKRIILEILLVFSHPRTNKVVIYRNCEHKMKENI